jgi:hypothetical protein
MDNPLLRNNTTQPNNNITLRHVRPYVRLMVLWMVFFSELFDAAAQIDSV